MSIIPANKRFIMLVLLLCCFHGTSALAQTVELKNSKEISDATKLNDAIDKLSSQVMTCVENNNGKTQGCLCVNECSCKFKDDYLAAKNLYKHIIKKYPGWEDKVIFFRKPSDSTGYNLNLEGLKKQFSTTC